MKKALSVIFLCLLFSFPTFVFLSSADGVTSDDMATLGTAFSYEGMSLRQTGDNSGIRSLWSVNKQIVAQMESAGYKVSYGAIMGISTSDGVTYNASSQSLTVEASDTVGFTAASARSAACVVYTTGGANYASGRFTSESATKATFAYTTVYGGSQETAAYYNVTMVYRLFYALTKDGETTIGYVDESPVLLPEAISLYQLAHYFYYEDANKELYRKSDRILRVIASQDQNYAATACGGTADTLSDGVTRKIESGKTLIFTVTVEAPGFYDIYGTLNRENNYIQYLYCTHGSTGYRADWRLGSSGSATTADGSESDYCVADGTEETQIATQYLVAGENTLTFTATGELGISSLRVTPTALFLKSDDTLLLAATEGTTNGEKNYGSGGVLLRASNDHTLQYTVTPTVSGLYSVAAIARIAKISAAVTVTDNTAGGSRTVTYAKNIDYPNGSSSSAATILWDGTVALTAGHTYTVTIVPTGSSSGTMFLRYFALSRVADLPENRAEVILSSSDVTKAGTGYELLPDRMTYFVNGSASFTHKVTVGTGGLYALRMKAVPADGYRVQFDIKNTNDTLIGRSRIAGVTTAYTGDKNSLMISQITRYEKEYTGDILGYVYLSAGENQLKLAFSSDTKAIGVYSLEYSLAQPDSDTTVRVLGKDFTAKNTESTAGIKVEATNALFFRTGGWAEYTVVLETAGLYKPYVFGSTTAGKMEFTMTPADETLETISFSTYEKAFNFGSCSTSLTAAACDEIFLEAGTYTLRVAASSASWANFGDLRLCRTGTMTKLESGATGDTVTLTPDKTGMYEVSLKADNTAALSLLIDGVAAGALVSTGDATIETRSFGTYLLTAGKSYTFAVRNVGDTAVKTEVPGVSFSGERSLVTGYYKDLDVSGATRSSYADYTFVGLTAGTYTLNISHAGLSSGKLFYSVIPAGEEDSLCKDENQYLTLGNGATVASSFLTITDAGTYVMRFFGNDLSSLSAVTLTLVSENDQAIDLTQGSVVSLVNESGETVTIPSTNVSATVPYGYFGSHNPNNLDALDENLTHASNAGIKLKDQTGHAPLGIVFTIPEDGKYNLTLLYICGSESLGKLTTWIDDGSKTEFAAPGESATNVLHSLTVATEVVLTEGTHTLYIDNTGKYTVFLWDLLIKVPTATTAGETDGVAFSTDLDLAFTVDFPGEYRVTLTVSSENGGQIGVDFATSGNENSLFTGNETVFSVPAGESTLFVPNLWTLSYGVDYILRLTGDVQPSSVSLDLVTQHNTPILLRFDKETSYIGTITASNTYTDTSYRGFSWSQGKYTNYADYADYGITADNQVIIRSQDQNSGNKVVYDPLGIPFTVTAEGSYQVVLLYSTGGYNSNRISAYIDGNLTPGYYDGDPVVSGSNLTGTWVPGVWTAGETGIQLGEQLPATGGNTSLLYSIDLGTVYLSAGEHTLYWQNSGTYSCYMVGAALTPDSASNNYRTMDTDLYYADYDAATDTLSAKVRSVGCNSYGFPGYTVVLSAFDKNGKLLGSTSAEANHYEAVTTLTLSGVSSAYAYAEVSFTDVTGAVLADPILAGSSDYKVVYFSDTHLYDWEDMFFDSSAQRIAWAVQELLKEHEERGKIDLVVVPGDAVNNWLYEYDAATLNGTSGSNIMMGTWDSFELNGVTYTSQYNGVSYPAGSSGTENDALGVLRILSYKELMQPLVDAGIPVLYVHGNHDCYKDTIWEMAFETNQMDGYLEGALKYEEDASGNLLVPTYQIEGNVFSFITKVVSPSDPDYASYSKGYGKEFAYAMNDNVAYMIFDNYHYLGEDNGFTSNSSGRSWAETVISEEAVQCLFSATEAYDEVYVVLHSMTPSQTYLKDAIIEANTQTPGHIVAIMDGHTHYETAAANAFSTGIYRLTCGYLGVPMYNMQALFQEYPFSYRIVEKHAGTISSYIALFENDYPTYTFSRSSGAVIPAFYQPYLRRNKSILCTDANWSMNTEE